VMEMLGEVYRYDQEACAGYVAVSNVLCKRCL
jgi:hypothetical protein